MKDDPVIVTGVPTWPELGLSDIAAWVELGVTVNRAYATTVPVMLLTTTSPVVPRTTNEVWGGIPPAADATKAWVAKHEAAPVSFVTPDSKQ